MTHVTAPGSSCLEERGWQRRAAQETRCDAVVAACRFGGLVPADARPNRETFMLGKSAGYEIILPAQCPQNGRRCPAGPAASPITAFWLQAMPVASKIELALPFALRRLASPRQCARPGRLPGPSRSVPSGNPADWQAAIPAIPAASSLPWMRRRSTASSASSTTWNTARPAPRRPAKI